MTSVYIASAEGFSGKSTVALGLLEQLARAVERVGVFRPIVRADAADESSGRDYVLDLLTSREACTTSYDEAAGVTYDEIHDDPDAALDRIVDRYHAVAEKCDAVVVVGSDYTDVATPTEFSVNARIAANIGAPVILVVNGAERSPEQLRTTAELLTHELEAHHATLAAIVANRCRADDLAAVAGAISTPAAPGYAIPDAPLLTAPTVGELMARVEGEMIAGDPELLHRESGGLLVAGMTLPNVLDRLTEGVVVVTAGDRPEIVLGVLLAHVAQDFPQIAAIVLNGGFAMPEQVDRLIAGLEVTTPILTTELGTHATVERLATLRGRLSKDSPRKVVTAVTLFDEHVDGAALVDRLELSRSSAVTPLMFEHRLVDMAVAARKHIVLPEGDDDRILRAADILLRRGVADLTLLGDPATITRRAAEVGADVTGAQLLSPHDEELVEELAEYYHQARRHKGIDLDEARTTVTDVSYFGTLMVQLGKADGMVSGAAHTTAHTIRPSLEVVRTVPGVSVVSSVFFMCLEHQVLVYGDCAVVPDPTAEQLADIAIASARTAAAFGVEPRVAMLSYSTGTSGSGTDVEKVVTATGLVRERDPDLPVEGPIQYDAAIDSAVAKTKLPDSKVAGQATVFVFPDLNTGNNTYKAVQRSAGAVAIGPVLQGLRKPVNDLSRGATVRDIVNTVAITAIQAQKPLENV
ncbi:phosphate acetyltransferase [Nocardioides caldifontis]|uniref:phosphate acetyltransferase n=1 Tax=Nocardioides caldifontis TaxID=2588938 RepID=UPI0011DFA5B7|nr:phosphate acetyltransferase [Nocardioides caldifontis]